VKRQVPSSPVIDSCLFKTAGGLPASVVSSSRNQSPPHNNPGESGTVWTGRPSLEICLIQFAGINVAPQAKLSSETVVGRKFRTSNSATLYPFLCQSRDTLWRPTVR